MQLQLVLALIAAMLLPNPTLADAPTPVSLDPVVHTTGGLTLVGPRGETINYTMNELEALPTFRLETTTPWRETAARFDGVLLVDLLQRHGLDQVSAIHVVAENDYTVTIPQEVWEDLPILVATRADDQPISRRERGPVQFVIAQSDFEKSDLAKESYLVWMVARIEPVE